MGKEGLPPELEGSLWRVCVELAERISGWKQPGNGLVVGVNGAQGTGKSTLCGFLQLLLRQGYGLRTAVLSIDDFYRTGAERTRLAEDVHHLLATRGVPGTHDVELGLAILNALASLKGGKISIPRFDKAKDDRCPKEEWTIFDGPADIILFEGWCVGSRPQTAKQLEEPINELERFEDGEGIWRSYVNCQLEGPYAEWFGLIDRLILLKAPDLESVFRWRGLQERKLAEKQIPGGRIMDEKALKRFIMHYERLTRHNLRELPARADLILLLNSNHQITEILSDDQQILPPPH